MAFQLGLLTSTGRKGRLFSLSLALLEWHEIKPVQNNVNICLQFHTDMRERVFQMNGIGVFTYFNVTFFAAKNIREMNTN